MEVEVASLAWVWGGSAGAASGFPAPTAEVVVEVAPGLAARGSDTVGPLLIVAMGFYSESV